MAATPNRRPVTDHDYDQVRQLHAAGKSRNEIAKQLHRSGRTISRLAAELGLTFDREQVKVATEARKADAKARRTALALALLADAERLRAQLFAPAKVFNFGGRENTYNETTLPEPTFVDKRNIMQAVGVAVDRAVKLDEYDSGTGLDDAISLLDRIAAGLRAKHGDGNDQHPTTDG